jgi:hypothetical protein
MAMEMMQSSQKNASFPHSHSLGDDSGFPFFSRSFNFNLNEKCYLHARYFLLPTCPLAHTALATEIAFRRENFF